MVSSVTTADQGPAPEASAIGELLEIMKALREPHSGCPWDLEQSFETIAPYTVEEAYEVLDVIQREAWEELPGELGDLLLQVVYHAQLGSEAGLFDFEEVVRGVSRKMIDRHPHVFGNHEFENEAIKYADAQAENWEAIKSAERGEARILSGVAKALPALSRAEKLQKRAARIGFDWKAPEPILEKIHEELEEIATASNQVERELEIGDLLFAVCNYSRHLEIDPEEALRKANQKFERRFNHVEDKLKASEIPEEQWSLHLMERYWKEAKSELG